MPLSPLVEPAAELDRDQIRRYSRHLIIPDVGVAGSAGSRLPGSWWSAPVGWAAQR